jgi:hypothetical protein
MKSIPSSLLTPNSLRSSRQMIDTATNIIRLPPEDVAEIQENARKLRPRMRENYFRLRHRMLPLPLRQPTVERETEYFTPQESSYCLMPPLPEPPMTQYVKKPAQTPIFEYWDDTVYLLGEILSLFIEEEDVSPPSDSDLVWDVPTYYTNQKTWGPKFKSEPCYVPKVQNIELTDVCLTEAERTPCDVVPFGYLGVWPTGYFSDESPFGQLILPLTTLTPQSAAPPLLNAHFYQGVLVSAYQIKKIRGEFGTKYFICNSSILIPAIPRKSAAKTKKGIARFRERREDVLLQRKEEYRTWEALLREIIRKGKEEAEKQKTPYTGFEIDHTDRLTYCKQCGATFFTRKQGKLRCFDCGWCSRESWVLGDSGDTPIDSGLNLNRETTKGTPNREQWFKSKRLFFNPDPQGKKWTEATAEDFKEDFEDTKNDPRFQTALAEYQSIFSGSTITELAEELGVKPDTLKKRMSRQEYTPVRVPGTAGYWFCVATLKGENHIKILGAADAPLTEILDTYIYEWCKSEKNAVKQARENAKKTGADQHAREKMEHGAIERIRDAYDTVIGVRAPGKKGFSETYRLFDGRKDFMTFVAKCKDL